MSKPSASHPPIRTPAPWLRCVAITIGVLILGVLSARCGDAPAEGTQPGSGGPGTASGSAPGDASVQPGNRERSGAPATADTQAPTAQPVEFVAAPALPEVTPGGPPADLPDGVTSVRIVASGSMLSSLEPCGCAKNQIGGLSRRMFHLSSLPRVDLRLEGGNTIREGHELDFQKWFTAMNVLHLGSHPYHIQGVGPKDLLLPQEDFRGIASQFVPLVASDLVLTGDPDPARPWTAEPFREVETEAGITVRIADLVGAKPAGIQDLKLLAPEAAWQRAMAGAAPDTLRIALVHGDQARAYAATALAPRPDLVVGMCDALTEAPAKASSGVDGVPVVFPGNRGRYVLELGLARIDGVPYLDYRATPLEGSASNPKAMRDPATDAQLMAHRMDVAESGALQQMANQRPTPTGDEYVGSQRCANCHVEDHAIWAASAHAHAWATLEKAEADPDRYGWPVTKYPECVGCHTVGYGEISGFVDPETTPELKDVGCESCHGPGGQHVLDPVNHKPLRGDSLTCTECHDHEQSPDFDYLEMWAKIAHGPTAQTGGADK